MTPKKSARLIGYVRVSTQEQAQEGASLDAQRRRIGAYVTLHEAELIEIVADEGVSAKTLDRPGLSSVLQRLRAGEADGIVVTKLDRLTRSTRDLLELVEDLCQRRGLALVSIAENVDTTKASGRLVITVLGALATWERETVSERTSDVLRDLRAQGVRMGRAGYGWRYGAETDHAGRRVVEPVAEERRLATRARALASRGYSRRAIARRFNDEGVATKRGGRWHARTIGVLIG